MIQTTRTNGQNLGVPATGAKSRRGKKRCQAFWKRTCLEAAAETHVGGLILAQAAARVPAEAVAGDGRTIDAGRFLPGFPLRSAFSKAGEPHEPAG